MTTFRISEAAALLGVSADTVRRWVDADRLGAGRDEHGHQQANGADLAAFTRSQIEESGDGNRSSSRNRFRGIVTEVIRDAVMAQAEIAAGAVPEGAADQPPGRRRARPGGGVVAVAVIKSTNVVVEIPGHERVASHL